MANKIKIGIVDDQQLFVDGIKEILASNTDIELIISALSGAQFLNSPNLEQVDILLMDIEMPQLDGFKLLETIRSINKCTKLKVLVLTMHNEKTMIKRMLHLGANGFITKDTDAKEVIHAINVVYNEGYYFNEHLNLSFIKELSKTTENIKKPKPLLSKREEQIVKMICEEFTADEIASKLGLSKRTIENHRYRILQKLNAKNTAGLVYKAIKGKIVS